MIGQLQPHVPAAGGEVLQQQRKGTYLLLVVKYCSSKGICRMTITVKEADPMKMIRLLPIILGGSQKWIIFMLVPSCDNNRRILE
jgi:hypothetical protein